MVRGSISKSIYISLRNSGGNLLSGDVSIVAIAGGAGRMKSRLRILEMCVVSVSQAKLKVDVV